MSVKKTEIENTKGNAKADSEKKQGAAEKKSAATKQTSTKSQKKKSTPVNSAEKNKSNVKSTSKAVADKAVADVETVKKTAKKATVKKAAEAEKPIVSGSKKKSPAKQNKVAETSESKNATTPKAAANDTKKSSGKTSVKKQEAAEPSSKTPHVMKLVDQKNDMINPTIMAGKSSIPRRLRGLEPLSRIIKREAEEVFGGDTETYNLTALVIEEHAPEILRRFNACDCDICVETLSRLTAEMVPARFAKLRRSTVERDLEEVRQLKDPLRRPVTSHMVRLVMQNKKRSYHD